MSRRTLLLVTALVLGGAAAGASMLDRRADPVAAPVIESPRPCCGGHAPAVEASPAAIATLPAEGASPIPAVASPAPAAVAPEAMERALKGEFYPWVLQADGTLVMEKVVTLEYQDGRRVEKVAKFTATPISSTAPPLPKTADLTEQR